MIILAALTNAFYPQAVLGTIQTHFDYRFFGVRNLDTLLAE